MLSNSQSFISFNEPRTLVCDAKNGKISDKNNAEIVTPVIMSVSYLM